MMETTPGSKPGFNENNRTDSPTSIISTPTKSSNQPSSITVVKTLVPLTDEGIGDDDGDHEEVDDKKPVRHSKWKTVKHSRDDDDDDDDEDDDDVDDHTKAEKSVGGDDSSSDDDED